LSSNLNLRETLAALRRGQGIPLGKKVLIVLDQFEQWLHAKKEEANTELVQALRQCDGGRVQCVVMVRDDFWMAATRFMRELEFRLIEGQNSAAVDLFDTDHARKVLAAFGRAFGKLPENSGETSKEQKEFLNQSVRGLAQEGKVICVRLALFAEMMKGKPWTPASLKAVGGTAGVGVAFLEGTFSAATAPPEHRYHQKAARADLKTLLPETGGDIKGHMRSYAELLEASGYGSRPKDFDDLLHILDNEIRLITPTDPEGKERADDSTSQAQRGQKYYQLTHDYLVHSIREWLTGKQKETRRGRAELLLAERAGVWHARPENRQLPSLWQWLQIKWLTQKKNWTPPQRRMMQKAARYHAVRGLVVLVLLILIGWGSYEGHGTLQAHALRDRLLNADTADVPNVVADMPSYRRWLDPLLQEANAQGEQEKDRRKLLHTSLALLPVDATQVAYLYGRLLEAKPSEVSVIRGALAPHKEHLVDKLWAVVEQPEIGKESRRLRAAAALAKYDPESQRWAKVQEAVSDDLVKVPGGYLAAWMDSLRPVRGHLLAPLSVVFGSSSRRDVERSLAMDILADYAADRPQVLADVLMDADERQFAVLFPLLKDRGEQGLPVLTAEIDRKLPPIAKNEAKEKLAKRQANAAVALLKMNRSAPAWAVLKHGPDPRARSYLVHRLYPLGVDAGTIIKRLGEEPDVTIRRALILSLGEYDEKVLPPEERQRLLPKLQTMYRNEVDSGLHAAAEWLLRTWKQQAWLKQVNEEWARDKERRDKRLESIQQLLTKDKEKAAPQWYVNGQGQTLVVIPGPVGFVMGSPLTEVGRQPAESQHKKRIGRTYALATTAVTKEQFLRYRSEFSHSEMGRYPDPTCPLGGVTWYEAAAYCNWLSKEEGIPEDQWCYEIKGQVTRLKQKYLSLTGYRLPSEAEMEYATRAGAVTSRYYGETDELLPKYGRYEENSEGRTWPVGSKEPNDLGLFDLHGNVFAWCQESGKTYPTGKGDRVFDDNEDILSVNNSALRVLRGGSFLNRPSIVRSAGRNSNVPAARNAGTVSVRRGLFRLDHLASLSLPVEGGSRLCNRVYFFLGQSLFPERIVPKSKTGKPNSQRSVWRRHKRRATTAHRPRRLTARPSPATSARSSTRIRSC
jgi:formylglycine-generating enzyme required for sulfatase activity